MARIYIPENLANDNTNTLLSFFYFIHILLVDDYGFCLGDEFITSLSEFTVQKLSDRKVKQAFIALAAS